MYDIVYKIIHKTMILRMISFMREIQAFLKLYDIVTKPWYRTWHHSLCHDIVYDIIKTIIKSLSWAIFIEYCLWYHMHFLWFCPWYLNYAISYLFLHTIYAFYITITRYHSHMLSQMLWYFSRWPYVMVVSARRGLGVPGDRCSTASSHAIANILGTCHGVQQSSTEHCEQWLKLKEELKIESSLTCAGVLESSNSFKLKKFKWT